MSQKRTGFFVDRLWEMGKMDKIKIQKLFEEFLSDKTPQPFTANLRIREWIIERKNTYNLYKDKFSSNRLANLRDYEFHHFLTFKGNKSWTNLPRACKQVTLDMHKLQASLIHIQDDSVTIENRLNDVVRGGKLYIKGFGKNLATGLLHVFNWHKYGVWNNRSQTVLTRLGRLPYISSSDFGGSYIRFNSQLREFATELNTDLVHLDGFLWWLDHYHKI